MPRSTDPDVRVRLTERPRHLDTRVSVPVSRRLLVHIVLREYTRGLGHAEQKRQDQREACGNPEKSATDSTIRCDFLSNQIPHARGGCPRLLFVVLRRSDLSGFLCTYRIDLIAKLQRRATGTIGKVGPLPAYMIDRDDDTISSSPAAVTPLLTDPRRRRPARRRLAARSAAWRQVLPDPAEIVRVGGADHQPNLRRIVLPLLRRARGECDMDRFPGFVDRDVLQIAAAGVAGLAKNEDGPIRKRGKVRALSSP